MKVHFTRDAGFHADLRRQVDAYFLRSGRSRNDDPRMFLKTAIILGWFAASWVLLVFVAATWWQGALAAISLALALAGIGFSVQHDANHGAYSKSPRLNRLVGFSLDVLGGSSYIWRWKHNVYHHTFTNVVGADDDIDVGPLARVAPAQPRRPIHRYQQFYMWALYCLLVPKWHFVDDFKNIAQERIVRGHLPRPQGWEMAELVAGKVLFFAWAFAIPALFHPLWVVAAFYLLAAAVAGLTMTLVFQGAHCLEAAEFPEPRPGEDHVSRSWAVQQVETSVDFGQKNPVLTWYVGGLNFQIEHHLFPKICHVHYPQLAPIVKEVCEKHGVRYVALGGFVPAVAAHARWLRAMGRAEEATPTPRRALAG